MYELPVLMLLCEVRGNVGINVRDHGVSITRYEQHKTAGYRDSHREGKG